MPRAWVRMPAMYDLAIGDRPYDDSASANAFRSCSIEYRLWWVCMPEPLIPWIGLGMNVAYRPCCWAMALRVVLKVTALSAVWSASAYSKSISCWPAATSWCAASTRMPNASSASTMSWRIVTARSVEKSK
jgi:hypothetical protein